MSEVIEIKIKRKSIAQGCGLCAQPDFSIVDDFIEGLIVVCDNCGAIVGQLIVSEDK